MLNEQGIPLYWAGAPIEEIGPEVMERVKEHYEVLRNTGLLALYQNIHAMFYGLGPAGHETSKIIEFGDSGEKLGVRSNQIRSLIRYILTSATADRPALQPKATNASPRAMAQVPTTRRILEYYYRTKRLERHLVGCALRALLYGKGYIWQGWDPGLLNGKGDLMYRAMSPMEVASDPERGQDEHDWFAVVLPRNKYDLIARFAPNDPVLAAKIDSSQTAFADKDTLNSLHFAFKKPTTSESDMAYEVHFMHRKTSSVPLGRYTTLLGDGTVLIDGPLHYPDIPISEMIPEEFLEAGSVGYSSAWDLIGLQQSYDSIISTMMSNFDAFGHNDMLIPDGVELSVEYLREGLSAIRYPMGEMNKPSILEKFSIKEEAFKLRDLLKSDMETNLGVNSVARGEPQSSLQTGPALALVQAQAIHFQTGFIGSYTQLIEDSSTISVRILKKYAPQDRLAAITGEGDKDGLAAFCDPEVDLIDRIEVERGNPVFRTLAGKYDIADKLMERGLISSPQQYFEVLETGRLEAIADPPTKAQLQIDAENAMLLSGAAVVDKLDAMGQPVLDEMGMPIRTVEGLRVVMTDPPDLHMMGHKTVLDSPESRNDPKVVEAVVTHMLEHIKVWRESPPDFLMLMGYPVPGVPAGEDPMSTDGDTEQKSPSGDTPGKPKPPRGDGSQPSQPAPKKDSGQPSLPKAPKTDKLGRPTGV